MPNENDTVSSQTPDQAPPTVMDTALDWLIRLEEADPAEREAFILWLDADPAHAAAFDQAERAWNSSLAGAVAVRTAARLAPAPTVALPTPHAPAGTRRRRRWSRWATAASLILAVLVGTQMDLPTRLQADVITARGEQQRLPLEDGSQVMLDSASALALDFDARTRRARLLRGAAYFDVARDPSRPFLVEAGSTQIRVVGTAFAVRYLDEQVRVSVERGIVEVSVGSESIRLSAGQEASLSDGRMSVQRSTGQSLAWVKGRLAFEDVPLSDILDELRRHYPGWILVADAELESLAVTGNYRLDNPLVTLRALAALAGAELSEWPGVLILRR